jgi:hypothetical protein
MADNSFFKNIPGIFSRERLRPNKRLVIFIIFIFIATIIWLLWTLEKEYTTVISNPVEFTGLPQDWVLANKLPEKIQLEVTGSGFAILRHNWDINKSPLRINFKNLYREPTEKLVGKTISLSLNPGPVRTRMSNQLSPLRVNSVIPDSISFVFAEMTSKKVPVNADVKVEMEKQYMLKGDVKVIPDSIEITGPSTILDTIGFVQTTPLDLKKINGNVTRSLAIKNIHNKVSLSKKRVQVEIPVEQYTEKSIEIPLTGINVPDSLHLKLFPAEATVTFRVVVSEFRNIQPENFLLTVDYSQIPASGQSKLTIKISDHPSFIGNIKVNPETVSYILEAK